MAVSLATLEKLLDASLAEPLMGFAFQQARRLIFQREILEVKQMLRFPTRVEGDAMLFNANGAVRFERIEQLLGNADPLFPTVMMPVHLLRPNKKHFEWRFLHQSSGMLIDQVLADCRQYLLPFIEKMSVMRTLKNQLIDDIDYYANVKQVDMTAREDGKVRLVLSPEQRVEKLAAIYVLEGKKDEAEHLIDSEVVKLAGSKPLPPRVAQRLRLERLKTLLLG